MDYSSIAGGAGSLLGSAWNFIANERTNAANRSIANKNNKANYELYLKQYQDSIDLWKMQNAYNDPSAQRARLERAGINPYTSLGSNPSGVSGAAPSLPTATPMQGATMHPYFMNPSDVANSVLAFSQAQKNDAETKGVQIDNLTRNQLNIAELGVRRQSILEAIQRTKKTSKEYDILKTQLQLTDLEYAMQSETYDIRKQGFDLANQYTQANIAAVQQQKLYQEELTAYQGIQNKLASVELKYKPQQIRAALANTFADTALKYEQKKYTGQLSRETLFRTYKTSLEAQGVKNANEIYEQTKEEVWRSYALQNGYTEEQTKTTRWNRSQNMINFMLSPFTNAMSQLGQGALLFGLGRGLGASSGKGVTYKVNTPPPMNGGYYY